MSTVSRSPDVARQRPAASSSHRSAAGRKRRFWARHWFELVVAGLLSAGVFLLLEQFEIKETLWNLARQGYRFLIAAGRRIVESGTGLLATVEKSDLVGLALILLACVLLYWRLRERCVGAHENQDEPHDCPNCGHHLDRAHRTPLQRLASVLLWARIRRYVCTECGFHTSTIHRPHSE